MGKERVAFNAWFESLRKRKETGGLPARGTMAAGLVVLDQLKNEYSLDIDSHLADGRAQIRGLNPSSVQAILAQFGETRQFLGEGGRTNRGTPGEMKGMLDALRPLELERLSKGNRDEILSSLQYVLVEKVKEYHNRRRLEIIYDPGKATWASVSGVLRQAMQENKGGPVAQYLVGAKLQLRFPDLVIPNERFCAPDVQTGRLGDFQVGNTAFHVTVTPMPAVYEKCRRNLESGARVYLLVPDFLVVGARQIAEPDIRGKMAVEAIESFIANNIEELATFTSKHLITGFRRLLEEYNHRVDAIELDKSLLIEIPPNLK